jgi:DNA-binding CsgD family transcriptional regulator
MDERTGRDSQPNLPAWVSRLALPVWVTSGDGTIAYLNPRAEALIGLSRSDCAGQLCYLVIAGRTPEGAPLCCPTCRVKRQYQERREIEPVRMTVPVGRTGRQEVEVVIIALDDDRLVHCVVDISRERRLRRFIDRIALRANERGEHVPHSRTEELTSREKEIMVLLAEDKTLHEIAEKLGVSYATVRNHVQHILGKLGVHSILEAVAVYLLDEE